MNKTIARRAIKASAAQAMPGSWLCSFLITILSSLLPVVIMRFLPLRVPAEADILAAGGDAIKVLSLFLPEVVTKKTLISIAVTAALYLLVMCPFSVGVCRFFLCVARGEKGKLSHVFSVFTNLRTVFSSIWLNAIISFFSLLWGIVLVIIPSAFLGLGTALGSELVVLLSTVLLFICIVVYFLWTSRYTFALYVFAEGRSGGAWHSFRTARRLMSGRGGELMQLRASYFGWYVFSTSFPILVFVYNALCGTVYAKYLSYLRGEMFFGEVNTPHEL